MLVRSVRRNLQTAKINFGYVALTSAPMVRAGIPVAFAGHPGGAGARARLLSLALIVPIATEWPALGPPLSYMAREAAVKK